MSEEQTAAGGIRQPNSRVLDTSALRAMAHPLRIRIFDILSQYGPQTASSMAERLGESTGVTSYHLRALAKHDLIREVEGRGTARERWWERPRGSVTIGDGHATRSPAGRAATQLVVTETYRQRHQQLMDFLEASMRGDPDEWQAELSTASTRLTREQFTELSGRIQELITEAVESHRDQTGEGVLPYLIRLDIFPLIEPGAEPGGSSNEQRGGGDH